MSPLVVYEVASSGASSRPSHTMTPSPLGTNFGDTRVSYRLQQRSQSSNEYELFCGSSESASIGHATMS